MIEPDQDLQPLRWILSAAASQTYLRLLNDDIVDARGDVADELVAAGFAVIDPVSDLLVGLPPEVPIVRSLASMTHQWLGQRPDIARAERDLRSLARQDRRTVTLGNRTELVEEFTTREERGVGLTAALTGARSELSSMQSVQSLIPGCDDPGPLTFVPTDLLERGVAINFLYERSVLDNQDFLSAALDEVSQGVQARVAATLPADAILIDRCALLVLNCDDRATALYTRAAPLVSTFAASFDSLWATAVPIGMRNLPASGSGLTELHQMVLSNLMAGRSNDTIARVLKVDPRTVRRKVDDLCDIFSVDNRAALVSVALARLRD